MKIATSWSTKTSADLATREAYHQLTESLGDTPDFFIIHLSASYDCDTVMDTLTQLAPGIPIHGGTSCQGVMTQMGFHSDDGYGLGLMAICDHDGAYGVGVSDLGDNPKTAAHQAVQQALKNAGRPGEVPSIVLISVPPHDEESVIAGVESILGPNVPIIGGSAADNSVSGQWKQFANGFIYSDAVVAAVLFPSVQVGYAFHSGYTPSSYSGTVTSAGHRTVHEIDGRKAAEVYDEWTDRKLSDLLKSEKNILSATSLSPLGRIVGSVGGMPYYILSHPETVTSDGSLTLFSEIGAGDQIVQMTGTVDSLITRAGRVAQAAMENALIRPSQVSGAMVIFCAGCMLTVQSQMQEVVADIRSSLGDTPFLGTYTFGEQGCFIGGENRHGNLMISVIVFGR